MKSADHKTVASQFATFVGLTFALALGFFVVSQGTYTAKGEGETVLGTSTHTTTVTRTFNGDKYTCKKTECDKVANGGGALSDDTDEDANNGPKCRSVKDSKKTSVCYWDNPILTAAQCNVDKSVYRNRGTDRGALNLYFSEDAENNVYYDCKKIVPTKQPTPTPTKKPTPTPIPCIAKAPSVAAVPSILLLPNYTVGVYWKQPQSWGKACPYNTNGYQVSIRKVGTGQLITRSPFIGASITHWTSSIQLQKGAYTVILEMINDGGKSAAGRSLMAAESIVVDRPAPTKAAPSNVR